jgi:hypothetical protein
MKLYEYRTGRPSMPTGLCAPAHEWSVGRLDVLNARAERPRLLDLQEQFAQQKSVQLKGAQLRINGLTAKAIGMAKSPATAGAGASGVPPRGRPV